MKMKTFVTFVVLAFLSPAFPAHAVSKEIIQLQTQVQELQDAIAHLQTTNDERMGVLQHLIEQTADNVNKMHVTVTELQNKLGSQTEGLSQKTDGVSGQVQSLNDSVDELKSRIGRMEKQLTDMQSQLANNSANGIQGVSSAGGLTDNNTPPATAGATAPAEPQAPPLQQLYQSGLRDYNSAKYDLATSEFSDVVKFYPREDLAGNAQYYIAEISYRQGKYPAAIKGYDAVLEQFPGNAKAPAAQLRKGESLIQLNQKDAGIREMRSLIQRYPQSPEAQQARNRLNALGIRISPKPSAAREQSPTPAPAQ